MSTPAYKEDFITDTESGSSEEASGSEEDVASWISWFCSLKGNEFFCEVEENFIQDDFNLSGLSSQVQYLARDLLPILIGRCMRPRELPPAHWGTPVRRCLIMTMPWT